MPHLVTGLLFFPLKHFLTTHAKLTHKCHWYCPPFILNAILSTTKVIHHGRLYRNSFGLYIEELFYLNSRETLERLGLSSRWRPWPWSNYRGLGWRDSWARPTPGPVRWRGRRWRWWSECVRECSLAVSSLPSQQIIPSRGRMKNIPSRRTIFYHKTNQREVKKPMNIQDMSEYLLK